MWKSLNGILLLALASPLPAVTSSPLFARGYTVLPPPQKVTLKPNDFEFSSAWRIELGSGVDSKDVAVQSLRDSLLERFHLQLGFSSKVYGTLRLVVAPKSVAPAAATDSDKTAIAEQAYRIQLAPGQITITGNTSTGLEISLCLTSVRFSHQVRKH